MKKIGVLGAGTWGIALARMLARSENEVTVWSALEQEIKLLSADRVHPNLPGIQIPQQIRFTSSLEEACRDQELLLFAVPSPFVRETARKATQYVRNGQILVNVAKGIEAETLLTMSEVILEELQKNGLHSHTKVVALSGPTHAEEVARDLPTTIVSAHPDPTVAEWVQEIFMNTCMRVYVNDDIRGVELCGAMKNIMALASGMSAGLGYGDNTRAALITRGMAEITRLGLAMNCKAETFSGLAGIGDLIVTATSTHSRNNRAGFLIGQGYTPAEATKKIGMVVEGINALPAAIKLAQNYQVELPLTFAVNAVIHGETTPAEAVQKLMEREKKSETKPAL